VAGVVIVAVVLPVWIMVGQVAQDRAVEGGRSRAAAVRAILAVAADPAAVKTAIDATQGDRADRFAVHRLGPEPIGSRRATDEQTEQAIRDRPGTPPEGEPWGLTVPVPGGVSYLQPVDLPDGPEGADRGTIVVEVFVPEQELTSGVGASRWALVGAALLLLLAAGIAGDRLMFRSAAAARAVAAGARSLGQGDHDVRVEPSGPRELAEVGTAFNAMATMVSKRRSAERELMADLSHRLRTPMTALRLEAERVRAMGAAGYRLAEAVEAMEREVDHLINIARRPYEESATVEPDTCDAAAVVLERMTFWAAVADDQSRPYRAYGLDRPAPVPLPASELAAALDALLGNVFRYTPQGTAFEVALSRRSGYVALRVDDAGPGIASRDFALRRGTSGRGSTGLGLDIVRKAAVAARGGMDIDRSAALGGTSVVVLLADADPTPTPARQLLGFVGRLKREPDETRWGRRARAARAHGLP